MKHLRRVTVRNAQVVDLAGLLGLIASIGDLFFAIYDEVKSLVEGMDT